METDAGRADLLTPLTPWTTAMKDVFQREVDDLASHYAYWLPGSLHSLWMHSDLAGWIISEACIPLVGWQEAVEDGWLDAGYISGIPLFNAQDIRLDGTICMLNSRGTVFDVASNDTSGTIRFAVQSYDFDDGMLVRRWSHDRIAAVDVCQPCVVRQPSDKRSVTESDAVAIIAALLRAFDEYRLSLGAPSTFPPRHGREVEAVGRRFLRLLRDPESSAFAEFALTEHYADGCEKLLHDLKAAIKDMERRTKPKAARTRFMGPLQVAFKLLYGVSATSHFEFEGDDAVQRADGPFIRFAHAFFAAVGCPCKRNTINSALQDWRREQRATPTGIAQ